METILNLTWVAVAVVMVRLWLCYALREGATKRTQIPALVMLLVILFPVISVTDDIWSVQNPAETDTCQRRDHLASCPHSIFPAFAALPEHAIAEIAFSFARFDVPLRIPLLAIDNPALDPIQNRPPPVA